MKEVNSDFFKPLGNESLAKDLANLLNKKKKHLGQMTNEELVQEVKPLFEKNGETWEEPSGEEYN